MKTLKNYTFLLLFILVSFISSCKKEDNDGLPAATQEGRNTFGCKVNGQVWLPFNNDWKGNKLTGGFSARNECFIFAARYNSNSETRILLNLNNIKSPILGKIIINSSTGNYFEYEDLTNNLYPKHYTTDSLHTGYITFTKFDATSRTMSGTFEFEAVLDSGTETVKVTDGRFDLKYENYQ